MTGDETQGTMGKRKSLFSPSFLPSFFSFLCAQIFIERETSGYTARSLGKRQIGFDVMERNGEKENVK